MDTASLIATLTHHLEPALLAIVVTQLVRGQDAIERIEKIREQAAERQRRKRETDAASRDSRDPPISQRSSPTPPKETTIHHDQKRGTLLSDDWVPSEEDRAYAIALGYRAEEIDSEVPEFVRFWQSRPGGDGHSCNWSAQWAAHIRFWQARRRYRGSPPQERTRPTGSGNHAALDAAERAFEFLDRRAA